MRPQKSELQFVLKLIPGLLVISIFTSCIQRNSNQGDDSEPMWGHLNHGALLPDSPQYLINKQPGQTWRACVPQYMEAKYPGFSEEIKSAVNIWAHYIGRKIEVEIVTKDLPPARLEDTSTTLRDLYNQKCGDGGLAIDAVFGLVGFQGTTVGETGAPYRYRPRRDGTEEITSFTRHLFLRDYSLTPDPWGTTTDWISFAGRQGSPQSAVQLQNTLQSRTTTQYQIGAKHMTLPVLIHEIGHVWGLCDQYEGANNCDPRNSTSHIVLESLMGSASAKERVFLMDDDILGIRALQARPGFAGQWQVSTDDLTRPAASIVEKPIDLLRIEKVTANGTGVEVTWGAVSKGKSEVQFEVLEPQRGRWNPLQSTYRNETGFDNPRSTLNINLGRNGSGWKVRAVLKVTSEAGATSSESVEAEAQ